MSIFANTAPAYWAAGLAVIPLIMGEKRPAIARWQTYSERLPDEEEKAAWLRTYPNANIGLVLGAASGVIAVDIDTTDPFAVEIIERVLPPSPWRRVGAKGSVRLYRYNGERTLRLQAADGMVAEILSTGSQVVLPPSIHPDTQRPYTANIDLLSVLTDIPDWPLGAPELLRKELLAAGVAVGKSGGGGNMVDFVPAGQRDTRMTSNAGMLARAVIRGDRTLIEALDEMRLWVEEKVDQIVGDPLPLEKSQRKIIEFLLRDIRGKRKLALPSGWDAGLTLDDIERLGLDVNENEEKWPVQRIIDQLAFEFQQYTDVQSTEFHNAIQENLVRLARSSGEVTQLDEERVLRFINNQSFGAFTMGALRKALTDLRRGDIDGENHDEVADAVIEHLERYGDVLHDGAQFYQWGGSHWVALVDDEIIKVISSEFGDLPASRKTSDYLGILRLMKAKCSKSLNNFGTTGINFANGFLDQELRLLPHHPDHGATYVLPYRYLPDIPHHMPIFESFLETSWSHNPDHADKRALLQEMMGATLFQVAPSYQKAFLLYGQGGSGKSVASQVVRGLLPDGVISSVPPEKWSDKFSPAELKGKVMNIAGELSETRFIPGDIFKIIVEGETMQGERKNQHPFNFKPVAAQWFNANVLPRTKDTSLGFTRRWMFLEWSRTVPEDQRVPDLAARIVEQEREAIAVWAVEGFKRLRSRGTYTRPESHEVLRRQLIAELNPVARFLEKADNLLIGRALVARHGRPHIPLRDLFEEYLGYFDGRHGRLNATEFKARLRDLEGDLDVTLNDITGQVEGIAMKF